MKHMKIYQIIAAACLSLGLLSCSEKTISVTGVTLGTKSLSMEVGDVETDRLVGKVVFRAFPFNKIGPIHNPYEG